MSSEAGPLDRSARQRNYRRGMSAESIVAGLFLMTGHRILQRRYASRKGEIDLIVLKNNRVGFVEVKRRASGEECEAAITPRLRYRVRRAADLWLARNPKFQNCEIGFDLVFVIPWRVPLILRNAL